VQNQASGQKGDNTTLDPTYPSDDYNGTLDCDIYQPSKVLSLSYGKSELYVPMNYIERNCRECMELSL